MCLSIGTPKNNKFPFVPNGKLIIFRCSKIWAHYSLIIMCLNIGTPKNYHFLFGTNENVVVSAVPILKHFFAFFFHAVVVVVVMLLLYIHGKVLWSCQNGQLTLLHSERPKLHTILAFLSAIGLN